MEITGITYGRTMNIGNYESEKIELSAMLTKGDKVEEVIEELREVVTVNSIKVARMVDKVEESNRQTMPGGNHEQQEEENEEAPTEEVKAEPKKRQSRKKKEENLEVVKEEPKAEVKEEIIEDSEVPVEHQPELPIEEPKKERGKPVKFIPYDNTDQAHKEMIAALFSKHLPEGWKKNQALKEKATAVSKALVGTPFIGKLGEVLEEFENALVSKLV